MLKSGQPNHEIKADDQLKLLLNNLLEVLVENQKLTDEKSIKKNILMDMLLLFLK